MLKFKKLELMWQFAEVDWRMGRSGSTIAKYTKLDGTPKIVKHTLQEVVRNKE